MRPAKVQEPPGLLPSSCGGGSGVNTGYLLAAPAPQDTQAVVLRPVLWMFLGVLVTFLVTRSITRLIRSRSARGHATGPVRDITIGGVHIHHQVFGIVIMLGAGLGLIA